MDRALIIAGFPGVGKSEFFKTKKNLRVLDSDSSKFSWLSTGERNPDFPANYIQHIQAMRWNCDIIMISTHNVVLDALEKADIPYVIVYPKASLKAEYLGRYKERGSPQGFLNLLNEKWDDFIGQLERRHCFKYILSDGEYLTDAIRQISRVFQSDLIVH